MDASSCFCFGGLLRLVFSGRHRFVVSGALKDELEAIPVGERPAGLKPRIEFAVVEENRLMMEAGHVVTPNGAKQELPSILTTVVNYSHKVSSEPERYQETTVCVANVHTLTAAIVLGDACILNHAHESIPGGKYLDGAFAQEEGLCRLLPQLYPSLMAAEGGYPIQASSVLFTPGLSCVRKVGDYAICESQGRCSVMTAAMPQWGHKPITEGWKEAVNLRIRAVLHAAKASRQPNLVLGAWGCNKFGNDPSSVAALFKLHLTSPEFRGCFKHVVFAIKDSQGRRIGAFKECFSSL